MAINVDLGALERSYREMSDEEFIAIRREDLTSDALAIYDKVATDRLLSVEKLSHPIRQDRPVDTSTARHSQMASHLDFISLACVILGGLCALLGLLFLSGIEKRLSAIAYPIFLLPSALLLASGIGLRRRAPWGRIVTIVGAVLYIACPLSWYVLWVITRRETKELFGWRPRPGDLAYLASEPSTPSSSPTVGPSIPGPEPVTRPLTAPRSTFWLTWKEFVTVMGVLMGLAGLSVLGDAYRTRPPYKGTGDSVFDSAQLFGTIGGIYIVTFFGRLIFGQHRQPGSAVCGKCGGTIMIGARFCNNCGHPVGATSTAA